MFSRWLGCLVAVAALTLLTGCVPDSPIYVGWRGGDPAILICEGMRLESIDVLAISDEQPQGERIWYAFGEADLDEGAVIVLGDPPSGLETRHAFREIPSTATVLGVTLQTLDSDGQVGNLLYEGFDRGVGVAEDQWLTSDGRVVSRPC